MSESTMNIFLDTNVFLSFYHFTKDDLEELRKLEVLIKNEKVKLFLPDQVVSEFIRNREAKILEALDRFKEEKLNESLPQICREHQEEADEITKAIRDYKDAKRRLLSALEERIRTRTTKADQIIKILFEIADTVEASQPIIRRAWDRRFKGNPPGKGNSNGDAINWECLLEAIPCGEDLYLIADDVDYRSKIDQEAISPFLKAEWTEKKKSEIHSYRNLSSFFKDTFPDIKLAYQLEKAILIKMLAESPTFKSTRGILSKLSIFSEFTDSEVADISVAATTNNQVYWISDEQGIRNRINECVKGHESSLDSETYKKWMMQFFRPRITKPTGADEVLKTLIGTVKK